MIPPARVRVLKVASPRQRHVELDAASSTALRPQIAIVSCGRGNRFGHPSPAVLARYRQIGAAVYRTDQQGAITIDTDGRTVNVTPFVRPVSTGRAGSRQRGDWAMAECDAPLARPARPVRNSAS